MVSAHAGLERGDLVLAYRMHVRVRDLDTMYPHNRHLPPKVRAFIDFAADVYATPAWIS